MYKVACTKRELSCIIATIFEELLPVCEECSTESKDDELIIKGRMVISGNVATLKVTDYGCDFIGDIELLKRARKEICLYDAALNTTEKS